MGPLKIGFIAERMLQGFGVDLVIHHIACGLADRGHEVTVYASVSDATLVSEKYRLELIPTPTTSWFPKYDLAAQRHLKRLNREGNDVWFVETFPFFSYLPRLDAPAVAVDYGVSSAVGFPLKMRANFAYVQFMQQQVYFRRARRIVTISEFLKSALPARLQSKADVIYCGADHYLAASTGAGDGAALRQQLGVAADETLLLYVGRLNPDDQPYKGTAGLVDLYRVLRQDHPRLRLLMVGFGGAREREWLERAGVLCIDNAPADRMPDIYDACDIYVTASQWEGFDLPLAEAQSFGKPVVALDIGAHPEVVDTGKSGFLTAGMAELGAAVVLLAEDGGLRQRMGQAARQKAASFTWERTVDQYEDLLGRLLPSS
ncbi:MAG: glycosyltransferase family 4 protein [Thermoleophilia bacterium]